MDEQLDCRNLGVSVDHLSIALSWPTCKDGTAQSSAVPE